MGQLAFLQNLVLLLIPPFFFLEEFDPFEFSAHDIPEIIDPFCSLIWKLFMGQH